MNLLHIYFSCTSYAPPVHYVHACLVSALGRVHTRHCRYVNGDTGGILCGPVFTSTALVAWKVQHNHVFHLQLKTHTHRRAGWISVDIQLFIHNHVCDAKTNPAEEYRIVIKGIERDIAPTFC